MATARFITKLGVLLMVVSSVGLFHARAADACAGGLCASPVSMYDPSIVSGANTPFTPPSWWNTPTQLPGPAAIGGGGGGLVVPNATRTGYINPAIPMQPVSNTVPARAANPVAPSTAPSSEPSSAGTQPVSSASPPTTSAIPPTNGVSVSIPAGWNIIGGPSGMAISGVSGPMYTFQAGDTTYETVQPGSPLAAGQGYWAYFTGPSTNIVPMVPGQSAQVQVPASHWIMIGNPGSGTATVTGVDQMLVYNAQAGQFQPSTTLGPGQGALVWSTNGGLATIQTS